MFKKIENKMFTNAQILLQSVCDHARHGLAVARTGAACHGRAGHDMAEQGCKTA